MKQLAVLVRSMQFFAHNAHNLASGKTFLEDHEFLGDLYETYEGIYDDIVERMIGEEGADDIEDVAALAADMMADEKVKSNDDAFRILLQKETELRSMVGGLVRKASDGTQNMLQGLADDSLRRSYKIGQRLK